MKSKKINFLFLLLTLHSLSVVSQYLPFYENKTSTNALAMMGLKGKVKSVKQRSYQAVEKAGLITKGAKGSLSSGSINSDFTMEFDTSARAIKEAYYDIWEVDEMILTHKYNAINNTEVVEQFENKGKMTFKYNYTYNSIGKIGEQYQTQIQYDKSTYENKCMYKYDAKGKLIEVSNVCITRPENGGQKTIYKYDEKGNFISKETYNDKGLIWFKETYKSDEKGNVIEHDYYGIDCKSIEHFFTYRYDSNNNVIEKVYNQSASKSSKTYSYTYEYDKTGNWIKRVDSENGKPTFILERQIDYY